MFKSRIDKTFLTSRAWTLAATTTLFLGTLMMFPEVGLSETSRKTSEQQKTVYLNSDRVYSYNLTAADKVTIDGIGIPNGATIVGSYEPAKGGMCYVARTLIYNNRTFRIHAASEVFPEVKDPRYTSAERVVVIKPDMPISLYTD
jgi:hypothetical protein